MDTHKQLIFYMNNDGEFIYVDNTNNIERQFSIYNKKNEVKLIHELNHCNNIVVIKKRNALHYFECKKAGIAHCISKLTTYLRLMTNYCGVVIIPNNTNQNIINLTDNIFDKIIVLKKNTKYIINNFLISSYIETMNNPNLMKPDNKYSLIVYNNDIYWFRTFINKYIDEKLPTIKTYDKIFVGKFEGQGENASNINLTKPRSLLGCIPNTLLEKFKSNGFVNIDPYNYSIKEVIYYIRNAKEIILSCGTAAHLYLPYFKQTTKLYYMINVTYEMGITYPLTDIDYNVRADIVQRFFPYNYKICFYKYAPYYDLGVNENNKYNSDDMLDFLVE
jgi:hypothetical protein